MAAADRSPAADVESHERLANLQKAIEELPHDLRTALLLFAVEGHSQQECAELLGVSAEGCGDPSLSSEKDSGEKIQHW